MKKRFKTQIKDLKQNKKELKSLAKELGKILSKLLLLNYISKMPYVTPIWVLIRMVTKWSLYSSIIMWAASGVANLFSLGIYIPNLGELIGYLSAFASSLIVLYTELDYVKLTDFYFVIANDYNKLLAKLILKLQEKIKDAKDVKIKEKLTKNIEQLRKMFIKVPAEHIKHEILYEIKDKHKEILLKNINKAEKKVKLDWFYVEFEKASMDPEYKKKQFKKYLKNTIDEKYSDLVTPDNGQSQPVTAVNNKKSIWSYITSPGTGWYLAGFFLGACITAAYFPEEFNSVKETVNTVRKKINQYTKISNIFSNIWNTIRGKSSNSKPDIDKGSTNDLSGMRGLTAEDFDVATFDTNPVEEHTTPQNPVETLNKNGGSGETSNKNEGSVETLNKNDASTSGNDGTVQKKNPSTTTTDSLNKLDSGTTFIPAGKLDKGKKSSESEVDPNEINMFFNDGKGNTTQIRTEAGITYVDQNAEIPEDLRNRFNNDINKKPTPLNHRAVINEQHPFEDVDLNNHPNNELLGNKKAQKSILSWVFDKIFGEKSIENESTNNQNISHTKTHDPNRILWSSNDPIEVRKAQKQIDREIWSGDTGDCFVNQKSDYDSNDNNPLDSETDKNNNTLNDKNPLGFGNRYFIFDRETDEIQNEEYMKQPELADQHEFNHKPYEHNLKEIHFRDPRNREFKTEIDALTADDLARMKNKHVDFSNVITVQEIESENHGYSISEIKEYIKNNKTKEQNPEYIQYVQKKNKEYFENEEIEANLIVGSLFDENVIEDDNKSTISNSSSDSTENITSDSETLFSPQEDDSIVDKLFNDKMNFIPFFFITKGFEIIYKLFINKIYTLIKSFPNKIFNILKNKNSVPNYINETKRDLPIPTNNFIETFHSNNINSYNFPYKFLYQFLFYLDHRSEPYITEKTKLIAEDGCILLTITVRSCKFSKFVGNTHDYIFNSGEINIFEYETPLDLVDLEDLEYTEDLALDLSDMINKQIRRLNKIYIAGDLICKYKYITRKEYELKIKS